MEKQGKQNTREEADVQSNSSIMLELNDSIINEARHAPSAPHTKDTSYTSSKTSKDRGRESERSFDMLSNATPERTSQLLKREDEAKLSSSLRMLFSKDNSDEEKSQISIDRSSHSEGEEAVIAIDDMDHATCGNSCRDFLYEYGCAIIIITAVSSTLITLMIIYLGWKVFVSIVLLILCLMLSGSDSC